jgi:hypothetical protein
MEIHIKNGTPQHGESLCKTCLWVHMIKGYSESEEILICECVYPNRAIPFAVRECSDYRSSVTPTPKQMEEIALIIPTEPARKPAGFAGLGFESEADPEILQRRSGQ